MLHKPLLSTLLLLVSLAAFAQEKTTDTSSRPYASPGKVKYRTFYDPVLKRDFDIPSGSGRKIAKPTYEEAQLGISGAASVTALSARTERIVRYDGSDWKRQLGTKMVDNILVVSGGIGFYYERQHNGQLRASWLTQAGYTDDAAPLIQKMTTTPGRISLTGSFVINTPIVLQSSGVTLAGSATLVTGAGVDATVKVIGKTDVGVDGLFFLRASGNTDNPISFLPQSCTNVSYLNNACIGVLGINTFRPAYNTATLSSLCYNVIVTNNRVFHVGSGPYGGAYTFNFVNGVTCTNNLAEDCVHGFIWWGGDDNPANGENNMTGTAPKWASNLTFSSCTVRHADRQSGNGGGIWGSMGRTVTVGNSLIEDCGDVGLDEEATDDYTATGNTVRRCHNAALACFYGSRNISYQGTIVRQGPTDGNALHVYGTLPTTNISIMGGSIVLTHPTTEPIFTEDGQLNGLQMGGGLTISSPGRTMTLQKTSKVALSAPLSITTGAGSLDSRPYAFYVQGGDDVSITPGLTLTRSGTLVAGVLLASDGGSGNLTNLRVSGIVAPDFALGIKNDQFLGGTGNKFYSNQVEQIDAPNGSPLRENNKNAAGDPVDDYLKQFVRIVTGKTDGTGGYAPFLTLPASAVNTYDYAYVQVMLAGWTSAQRKLFMLQASNRDNFSAEYWVDTDRGSVTNSIVAYQTGGVNGPVTFYVNVGTYAKISITYLSLLQSTGVSRLVFSSATPAGTKVYDTATNTASR